MYELIERPGIDGDSVRSMWYSSLAAAAACGFNVTGELLLGVCVIREHALSIRASEIFIQHSCMYANLKSSERPTCDFESWFAVFGNESRKAEWEYGIDEIRSIAYVKCII